MDARTPEKDATITDWKQALREMDIPLLKSHEGTYSFYPSGRKHSEMRPVLAIWHESLPFTPEEQALIQQLSKELLEDAKWLGDQELPKHSNWVDWYGRTIIIRKIGENRWQYRAEQWENVLLYWPQVGCPLAGLFSRVLSPRRGSR